MPFIVIFVVFLFKRAVRLIFASLCLSLRNPGIGPISYLLNDLFGVILARARWAFLHTFSKCSLMLQNIPVLYLSSSSSALLYSICPRRCPLFCLQCGKGKLPGLTVVPKIYCLLRVGSFLPQQVLILTVVSSEASVASLFTPDLDEDLLPTFLLICFQEHRCLPIS